MRVITPPHPIILNENDKAVFLAGSIEMGLAENWQDQVIQQLEETDWVVLNPRRPDWDSTWVASIDNPQFVEQVNWELEGLERSSIIILYFAPTTKAPISLLEFGLHARSGKLVVCCPEGYWRKGNVDVVCQRYGIQQLSSLEEVIRYVSQKI